MNKRAEGGLAVLIIIILVIIIAALLIFRTGNASKDIDSDNDGLTDSQEKAMGTDLHNPNTDGDRYLDGEDPNPLVKNSADISFSLLNQEGDYHYLNIIKDGILIAPVLTACTTTIGACASTMPILSPLLDDVIYTKTFSIQVSNIGNDYTSYLNYDVVYQIGDKELKRESYRYRRINVGEQATIPYSEDILVKDIPARIWDLISGRSEITIQIDNLNYEKF